MSTAKNFQNQNIQKITNCVEAESSIRNLCLEVNGVYDSEWCKHYFISTFPRLSKVKMGKILLGLEQGDKSNYYYVPNPF